MDQVCIIGGVPLRGVVETSGSKNAALPILIASLLTEEKCELSRVPTFLEDIRTTLKLMNSLGVQVNSQPDLSKVQLMANHLSSFEAPYDLVKTMRASILVLGPLIARFGQAKVSLPGGCAIGARPVQLHLMGLERLGANIGLENGYIVASAKKLYGNRIVFEFPSVGATENIMMAAVLAEGESILENCAREPEVSDLANFLKAMGATIEGAGTDKISIQGTRFLKGCSYQVMGDRIEAATFLIAGLLTQGHVRVNGVYPDILETVLVKLEEIGAKIARFENAIDLSVDKLLQSTNITTLPYPGFPTDMQAQFMSALSLANGASVITETIFENRFMHVPELVRLGADITIHGNSALVKGQPQLYGAPVMATDLRASASLVIAGLAAQGETQISRIYHLDRGYEKMEVKLKKLGANIKRVHRS